MDKRPGREAAFALLAVALVIGGTVTAVATAPGAAEGRPAAEELQFDPGVPTEYDFDPSADRRADGTVRVDGRRYDSIERALAAAESGDTLVLRGWFDETPVVRTPDVTLRSAPGTRAVVNGSRAGDVLVLAAENVTVRGLWVRNAGLSPEHNDAAVWVNASDVTVADTRITETTFGIWVDGVDDARLVNNTIVGRERITPLTMRGNGIQLFRAEDAVVRRNRITDVRDGIYYSWASGVFAANNTMWDLRYGVHYMYSDDCTLRDNLSFDNDIGYALMISERLRIVDNVAVNNTGTGAGGSGHGVLVKAIDHSVVRGNDLVGNRNGLFVYNSVNNTIVGNLVLANEVGVYLAAGSVGGRVLDNSFVRNGRAVEADVTQQYAWNGSRRGNYWGGATVADTDHDGVGEGRYRPAGLVARLQERHPATRVFVGSPAFEVVRAAERSLPVIESPGVVDNHPLERSPHDWRRYYDSD